MTDDKLFQTDKYCVFDCCGETFAVPALSVRSVTPAQKLSRLPLSHECLAGLANVHKEIVPVFDLSVQVGVSTAAANRQMLIMNSDAGAWGILIGQVLGLESIEVSFNGPGADESGWSAVNAGSASFQEQFVTVLDPDTLFRFLNTSLRSHWEGLDHHRQETGDVDQAVSVG